MIDQPGDHGGNLAAAAARFNRPPDQFVDFSSNINPLGSPPGLKAVLKKALCKINRYPVPHAAPFRHFLAETLDQPEENFLIGNGASDLIHLFFLCLRPRQLFLPVPTFAEYEKAALLTGCRVEPLLPNTGDGSFCFDTPPQGRPNLGFTLPALQQGALIVICNPNNPTGAYLPRALLEKLVDQAIQSKTRVLIDESFFPFTGFPRSESMAPLVTNYPNLWVLTSLTKLWALPGLRLGYLMGPAAAIKKLTGDGDPWRVNSLAQTAGMHCLTSVDDFTAKTVELVTRERRYLQRCLGKISGLEIFSGAANFLLAQMIPSAGNSHHLYCYLGSRGLLIREAGNFRGLNEHYFRIAVRRRRENRHLIDGIRTYFA